MHQDQKVLRTLTGSKRLSFECIRIDEESGSIELQTGDLIFGNRRSWMQAVMNVSGDFLSHVGVVDCNEEGPVVIEMGPGGVATRAVDAFIDAYRFICVARPAMHQLCRAAVVEEARRRLRSKSLSYTFLACAILESSMLLRRMMPNSAEPALNRLGLAAAQYFERHHRNSVTCSGFVYECLQRACRQCAIPAAWPTREPVSAIRSAPSVCDVRRRAAKSRCDTGSGVRSLITPYDIWVAQRSDFRFVGRDGRGVMLIDLADRRGRARNAERR